MSRAYRDGVDNIPYMGGVPNVFLMQLLLWTLVFTTTGTFAQQLLLPNETSIFSFKTVGGKTMMLAKDKSDKYLIYRFGIQDKIELEFPLKTKDSWKQFRYNFYLRGGGKQNAGLDVDNLRFTNKKTTYVVYAAYSAGEPGAEGEPDTEESYTVGIIIHQPGKEDVEITGNPETVVGSLKEFRTNGQVTIDWDAALEF